MNKVIQHIQRIALLHAAGERTDGQLLESFVRRREAAALEVLVRRHGPMVWGVCCRILHNHHDAEDAFQATFLVLVRKAASVKPREMVGNWLYGVAHQTALKAKATRAKRQTRERQMAAMPEPAVKEQDLGRDLQPVLDQELSRLPDKYRVAIVLCDLEGKTRKEAARQLGCPEGTLAARLTRGRVMLAKRLTRRGVALSGAALAAVLSQQASAVVPASVVISTIKAASLLAAGKAAAAGAISVRVASLMEGVMKAMLMSKLKSVAVILLIAFTCIGAGVLTHTALAARPNEAAEAKAKDEKPADLVERAAKDKAKPTAIPAGDVARTYLTNEALADERFTGKPVVVSGKMIRIERGGILWVDKDKKEKTVYTLWMSSSDRVDSQTDPLLSFRFTEDDRAELAKLKPGQILWVEGKPEGNDRERKIIYFFECRLAAKGGTP